MLSNEAVGNRTSSLSVPTYSYNSSNELTSQTGATYTYDNNGNVLTKVAGSNTTTYTWDFENRLASVALPGTGGTVTFKYDPFGRRIQKVSPAATSIYVGVYPERSRRDGDNQIEELNASGAQVVRYTQGLGIDEPLAMLRGGVNSYYHADGLGSIVGVSISSGTYSELYRYDSFGNVTFSDGSVTNSVRYTARELDTETGLDYYRARYYDPSVGRFLSEDPSRLAGRTNRYPYVANHPTLLVDPSGMTEECKLVRAQRVSPWLSSALTIGLTPWVFDSSYTEGPERAFGLPVLTCLWERNSYRQIWQTALFVSIFRCTDIICGKPNQRYRVNFQKQSRFLENLPPRRETQAISIITFLGDDEFNDIRCRTDRTLYPQ